MYKRVIAWIIRFIHNRKSKVKVTQPRSGLLSLNPIVDNHGILRVGWRQQRARFSYNSRYLIILDSKHQLTKPLIHSEHLRLFHGGSLLVSSSLSRNLLILGGHKDIRSIVRSCVICRRRSPKPKPQVMGQLLPKHIMPNMVFEHIGLDFAGPLYLKRGSVRKPVILKPYVHIFMSTSVKAVHLEVVSNLSESFIASLRRFVARREKPSSIWSDHGTNFVGANRVFKELYAHILSTKTEEAI